MNKHNTRTRACVSVHFNWYGEVSHENLFAFKTQMSIQWHSGGKHKKWCEEEEGRMRIYVCMSDEHTCNDS